MYSRDDEYIRAAVSAYNNMPPEARERIRDRFRRKTIIQDHGYYCPKCRAKIRRIANYCDQCGQRVTLEKPVRVVLD